MASKVRSTGEPLDHTSPTLVTEYIIVTPARAMANAAFIIDKIGVLSVDYEYANYDRMRMSGTRTNSYNYSDEKATTTQTRTKQLVIFTKVRTRCAQVWSSAS